MTLINASILAGVILAGLPILLHLMMKAKPKRIEFPALRLLQTRQTSNSRRMRVRHLLLLMLRAFLIAVAVIAVARPSLPAAQYGLRWYEWLVLITVASVAFAVYRWRAKRAAADEPAAHLLQDRRSRLKSWAAIGAVLASLMLVGVPWGMRVYGEVNRPRSPLSPDIPVAAVLVFDTSLSMTYKHESLTRLEQAQEISLSHLTALPNASRVAIATTHPESEPIFQADLAGVRSRIEDLKPYAAPRSLNGVIKSAIDTHTLDRQQVIEQFGTTDTFSREIYILTDMSATAWDVPDEVGLRDLLVTNDWLNIYLIDVSASNPNNVSITDLKLDRESTVGGQAVQISATISATPDAGNTSTVEIFMISDGGEEVAGGGVVGSPRQRIEFTGNPVTKKFSVLGDPNARFQRGFLRLATQDPMLFDDKRYFTFGVSRVPRVLLIGDRLLDTRYVNDVLQPKLAERQGIRRFNCKQVTSAGFARETLKAYDIICINNWTKPPSTAWTELKEFVVKGGNLFVSAGGESLLSTSHWNTEDAEAVLPGLPLVHVPFRAEPGRQLNLIADSHPICGAFLKDPEALAELSRALFDKCWTFEPHSEAREIMTFNDKYSRPAMLERSVGRGRVLMFTSAMDSNGPFAELWNESFIQSWSFMMLMDETMRYLTGASEVKRNFVVGEPVSIDIPADKRFSQYLVARPSDRLTPGTFPFDEQSVLLTDIDEAGHYQLRTPKDEDVAFYSDFASNDIDAESNLDHITENELIAILGEDRFSQVTDPEQLDRAVNLGRIGVEVFPVLMGLLVVLFCLEHLMANFFYDDEPQPQETTAAA